MRIKNDVYKQILKSQQTDDPKADSIQMLQQKQLIQIGQFIQDE